MECYSSIFHHFQQEESAAWLLWVQIIVKPVALTVFVKAQQVRCVKIKCSNTWLHNTFQVTRAIKYCIHCKDVLDLYRGLVEFLIAPSERFLADLRSVWCRSPDPYLFLEILPIKTIQSFASFSASAFWLYVTTQRCVCENPQHRSSDRCWARQHRSGCFILNKALILKSFDSGVKTGFNSYGSEPKRMRLHEGLKGFYFCNSVTYSNRNIQSCCSYNKYSRPPSPPPAGSFFTASKDEPSSVRHSLTDGL